ncbi:MAG: glycosyltransferase [Actinomycetia bacterium]|nr:glycosyltransferase [Actinomycetes bacterium]
MSDRVDVALRRPAVSVLLAAYRAGATIGRAVRSVLAQSRSDWELLVVSDDGTDYRPSLPPDPRIRFLDSGGVARGPSVARNAALRVARGEWITVLDADDWWHAAKLERLLELARHDGIAFDNILRWDDAHDAPRGPLLPDSPPDPRRVDFWDIAAVNHPLFPLIHRDWVRPFDPAVDFAEDVLFNLGALARAGGAAWLCPEPLHVYRVRADSLSHRPDAGRRAEAAYRRILTRLAEGESLGFPPAFRDAAHTVFEAKRAANRSFLASGAAEFTAFSLPLARPTGAPPRRGA